VTTWNVCAAAHGVTVAKLCRSVFSEADDLEVIKLALEFPYVDEGWKKKDSGPFSEKLGSD
jgi:hypothetical protein